MSTSFGHHKCFFLFGLSGRRIARGFLILGMAPLIAMLAYLAFALHSAATTQYRTAGRLHWKLKARNLVQGGLATAQARLAEDAQWQGETSSLPGIGLLQVHVLEGDTRSGWLVESEACIPETGPVQERLRLRAWLSGVSAAGSLPRVQSAWIPVSGEIQRVEGMP